MTWYIFFPTHIYLASFLFTLIVINSIKIYTFLHCNKYVSWNKSWNNIYHLILWYVFITWFLCYIDLNYETLFYEGIDLWIIHYMSQPGCRVVQLVTAPCYVESISLMALDQIQFWLTAANGPISQLPIALPMQATGGVIRLGNLALYWPPQVKGRSLTTCQYPHLRWWLN